MPARTTHRRLTLFALLMSTALSALEATVVTTAMPTVVGDLGGIAHYAWVFTGYLLAATVPLPLLGKLSDVHGRKPLLLWGLLFFTVGSLACGLATDMNQLIAFRILQGLGGGAMQTVGLTVTGDLFSLRERGRIQGLFSGVWGVAAIVGPVVGGFIADLASWRWIFLINVPIALLTFVLVLRVFHENREKSRGTPDVAGAVALSVAILLILGGVQRTIAPMLGLGAGAAALVLFVLIERRARDPLLPLSLLKRPIVAVSVGVSALLGTVLYGILSYAPLYAQTVMNQSPIQAGLLLTPMLFAWPISSTLTGRLIERIGFRFPLRLGLVCCLFGMVLVTVCLSERWVFGSRAAMVLVGLGQGFVSTALLLTLQNSVAWGERGIATALYLFARTTGGTIAAGTFGGILAAALLRVPGVPAGAADALLGPEHGRDLAPELLARLGSALGRALMLDFWLMGGLAAIALVVGYSLPRIPVVKTEA